MNAHIRMSSAEVVRLPVRLRVVPASSALDRLMRLSVLSWNASRTMQGNYRERGV